MYILSKDALKSLNIKERALQMRCKKLGFNKTLQGYEIPIDVFNQWKQNRPQSTAKQTAKQPQPQRSDRKATATETPPQTNIIIQSLESEIEALKKIIAESETEINVPDNLTGVTLLDNGNSLFVLDAKGIQDLEIKLDEWHTQRAEIQKQKAIIDLKEKHFDSLLLSKDEQIKHYQNQFNYQREQSTRILDIHEKLVETLDQHIKTAIQRNIIEAVSKDIINKDTWKPK